jgi:hypothetical protein
MINPKAYWDQITYICGSQRWREFTKAKKFSFIFIMNPFLYFPIWWIHSGALITMGNIFYINTIDKFETKSISSPTTSQVP